MRRLVPLTMTVLLLASCSRAPDLSDASALDLLIPLPAHVEPTDGELDLNGSCAAGDGDAAAPVAYLSDALTAEGFDVPVGTACPVTFTATGGAADDESYEVEITPTTVTASAASTAGLFAAAHTLRQLALLAGDGTLPAGSIEDEPVYGYRGFMLDVARRFYPVADVKQIIDDIALYKVNVLRLHLSDDQGWRIAIDAYPELTAIGGATQTGWPPGSGGPWFYSKADYQEIVAYAASRGITVVPEIDGPGHVNAAQASIAALNCDDQLAEPYLGVNVGFSLLCFDSGHVAAVDDYLTAVWSELAALTPGPYLHVGGDEADEASAEQYGQYVHDVSAIVQAEGKRVMGWHQLADGTIPAGSLLQYWSPDGSAPASLLESDADVVVSPASRAYLDQKYDSTTVMGMDWAGPITLSDAYSWDPATFVDGLDPGRVVGVEATLFADRTFDGYGATASDADLYVPVADYFGEMVFPRLPAIAEIGWHGSGDDWPGFRARIAEHDVVWDQLGIEYYRTKDVW